MENVTLLFFSQVSVERQSSAEVENVYICHNISNYWLGLNFGL